MLCVIAKLDNASTAYLQILQALAASHGARPKALHGHITLVTYMGDKEAEFITRCKEVLKEQKSFSVRYASLTVLPATSILTAMPEKSGSLVEVYQKLTAIAPERLNDWTKPEKWEPHTTLVYDPSVDLDAICARIQFAPFTAQVSQIQFSRVIGNDCEVIDSLALS